MHAFGQELAIAWRRWRQAPGLAVLAALTIGLAAGATTAVFSIVDPLLIRTLPVRDPDRLVLLHSAGTLQTIDIAEGLAYRQYAQDRDSLEGVLADATNRAVETNYRGRSDTANAVVVSANYFELLGVLPYRGRMLATADADGGQVAVLSYAYWLNAFGADPSVLGQTISVQGTPREIVGIAPRAFLGLMVGSPPDLYLPLRGDPQAWVRIVGRLRQGVSIDRARVALEPTFRRIVAASELPDVEKPQAMARLLVTPAGRGISSARDELGSRPWMLMAIVVLALLVACANVAGLVLTRAASRRQQMSIELALGATRGRLAARWLLEGAAIAALGVIIGLGVAHFGSRALAAWLSVGPSPIRITPELDWRLLGFAFALLVVTMLLCGAVPALAAARVDVAQGLRSRAGGLDRGARPSRLRRGLVVVQVAASVTLLSGAGLLVHSLANLHAFDMGFDPDRVLAITLRDRNRDRPPGQADAIADSLAQQTRAMAGVAGVAFGSLPPLSGAEIGINVIADARASAPPLHTLLAPAVMPEYFDAVGLRLARGEGCPQGAAGQNPSVVINERLATRLFGAASALGERVRFVEGRRPPMTVVGIVANSTYVSLREEPRNFLYMCYIPGQLRSLINRVLFVRVSGGAADALTEPLRALVRSTDSNLDVSRAQTLEAYRSDSIRPDRLVAGLSAGFAVIAVLISAVGLYGVLAATVVRQTPEIGLRMALGADARGVVRFVAVPAVALVAAGLALGIAGAAATASLLSSLLFGLGHVDPVTWAAVAVVLLAVCALACAAPVRRALRIDPVAALRGD